MKEEIMKVKIFFLFLVDLRENFNSNNVLEDYSMSISEMNDSNIINDRRRKIGNTLL